MERDEDVCRGVGDTGREEGRGKGRIKRMNKGDGREWIRLKMCEGVEGNRRVDVREGK